MKIAEAEVIANKVVGWCAKNLGVSKFHNGLPLVDVSYVSDFPPICGEYDTEENLIHIYTSLNRSVKCLVNTVLHEYTHYLQCTAWIFRFIAKYDIGKTGSKKNPYEIRATANALIYTEKCMRDLGLH